MSKNTKLKKAGKITIIIIACLALLFILLPFFDSSTAAVGKDGKKAAPQIFTSNPLADLVKKVYALIRGEKKPSTEQTQVLYAQNPQGISAEENTRYDAQRDESEQNMTDAAVSSVPVSYDGYEEAGIINEDGEWVLVRQTAPDAAQRGMHEINTSDTAYDKLVRLERSAKYTGHSNQTKPQYPDSKWARLWKPIKNLFSDSSSTANGTHADGTMPDMLAAANRMDKNSSRMGTPERFRRATLPASLGRTGQSGSSSAAEAGNFFHLFSPEAALNGVLDGLKALAEKDLTKEQNKQFGKEMDRMRDEQHKVLKQKMMDRIKQDAGEDKEQDLFALASKCSGGASGLYGKSSQCTEEEDQQGDEQNIANAQRNSLQNFSNMVGGIQLNPEDFNMLVMLGKADNLPDLDMFTRPKNATATTAREDKTLYEFYKYMFEAQGCAQRGNCFWVGADDKNIPDKTMPNTIRSAGMNYEGDPLGLSQEFIAAFQQDRLNDAETDEDREAAQHIAQDLAQYPPYYLPYTRENMQEIYGRNQVDWNDPKKPNRPILAYVPTAANTQGVIGNSGWDSPFTVFYGADILDQNAQEQNSFSGFGETDILDLETTQATAQERGAKLNDQVINQAKDRLGIVLESGSELQRQGLTRIFQMNAQKPANNLSVNAAPDEILGR